MKILPIGIQSFKKLREADCLYVDKTGILQTLIEDGSQYFLSRPRRFGKSLTISTLEAMFKGEAELFKGLKAEAWVKNQAEKPSPVLRFDMSRLRRYLTPNELNTSLIKGLEDFAVFNNVEIPNENTADGMLLKVIYSLYKDYGHVVVLIDEYDKPILDNISNLKKANEMREVLRSFYAIIKGCDEYLLLLL